jgi:hypothetical protein
MWHACLGEALPLSGLGRRHRSRLRVEWMREAEPGGDTRGHADRPVRARGDDPVHRLGTGEPLNRLIVLRRDDRSLVGEGEARRVRVRVGDEDLEPARTRRLEKAELRRPAA